MRIKDKKRFMIACGGLAAILILIIVVLTISFWNRNENQAEAGSKKKYANNSTDDSKRNRHGSKYPDNNS